ncbi:MAG TPA: chemotaxis protein CheW [Candidatus Sulfotelmatobacter sp.]
MALQPVYTLSQPFCTLQFCTFLLNGYLFGVPVPEVQEVIRYQPITPVPLAPPAVVGMINLRGQIVLAIDLRHRLALEKRCEGELPMNVVVRTPDGAVSLLVDEIGDVIEVDHSTFEAPPETLRGAVRAMILGVHKLDHRLLHLLDTGKACQVPDAGDSPVNDHL